MIDDITADRILDQFVKGYDPYLFAGELGLNPDDALNVIREFVRSRMAKEARFREIARAQGHHGAKGGRTKKHDFASEQERNAYYNARRKKKSE